ncbi:hypothetical protein M9H77_07027 [Catharanthus roseus]|uniref:Uncharacterized protein n=1 Tax=Catharanthus roseus TaxID=4058 RepID=A0ACC0BU10_CATRO|nr:hypothetical protein M9H77_07027 [Catharanthus roseus]
MDDNGSLVFQETVEIWKNRDRTEKSRRFNFCDFPYERRRENKSNIHFHKKRKPINQQLRAIRREFMILDEFQIRAPNAEERAHLSPNGWMAVYWDQLKAGLRFPLHNMFLEVTSYWRIDVGQIAPNGVKIIVAFILMYKLVRDGSGCRTFQRKSGAIELVRKMPQPIHRWKKQKLLLLNIVEASVKLKVQLPRVDLGKDGFKPLRKWKKDRSGKKKTNVLLVLETPVDPDSEDPGALVGESDEESSLVPEDMEEELLEGCLVDFSTCVWVCLVYDALSVNILNWPAQQMMHNFEVERRNVEKYKNRLGEIYQERLVAIDHATNMALMEINKWLTDECTVKDGEFRSLKESFICNQQDLDRCKEALMQKEQEGQLVGWGLGCQEVIRLLTLVCSLVQILCFYPSSLV